MTSIRKHIPMIGTVSASVVLATSLVLLAPATGFSDYGDLKSVKVLNPVFAPAAAGISKATAAGATYGVSGTPVPYVETPPVVVPTVPGEVVTPDATVQEQPQVRVVTSEQDPAPVPETPPASPFQADIDAAIAATPPGMIYVSSYFDVVTRTVTNTYEDINGGVDDGLGSTQLVLSAPMISEV